MKGERKLFPFHFFAPTIETIFAFSWIAPTLRFRFRFHSSKAKRLFWCSAVNFLWPFFPRCVHILFIFVCFSRLSFRTCRTHRTEMVSFNILVHFRFLFSHIVNMFFGYFLVWWNKKKQKLIEGKTCLIPIHTHHFPSSIICHWFRSDTRTLFYIDFDCISPTTWHNLFRISVSMCLCFTSFWEMNWNWRTMNERRKKKCERT